MIKDILDKGVAEGKMRAVDTKIVASLITGIIDGLVVQWITDPDVFNLEDSFDTTANVILNGLIKK